MGGHHYDPEEQAELKEIIEMNMELISEDLRKEIKKAAKTVRKLEWVKDRITHAELAAEYGNDPILPPYLKRQWNEVWQRELKRLVHLHKQYVLEVEASPTPGATPA